MSGRFGWSLLTRLVWIAAGAAVASLIFGGFAMFRAISIENDHMLDARLEQFGATLQALEKHLCDGPFMRRYEAEDDFGRPQTAFNVCSFWRVDALARIGRRKEAREAFEALLARRNKLGLLSEDLAPASGELWGNFPQTYSMVGIVNGAVRLSAPWDSVI